MSPLPPPGTDTSGPNYQDGLFSRITAIHFPKIARIEGAIFVATGTGANAFALTTRIKNIKDKIVFNELGALEFGGEIPGASYHKFPNVTLPVFVIGGNFLTQDPDTLEFGSGTEIMFSHDGVNWSRGFHQQWPDLAINDSSVFAMAWDQDQFYAGTYSDEYDTQIEVKTYEKLLTSADGESWAVAGSVLRYDSHGNPPLNTSPPALFMPHINPVTQLPDGRAVYYEKRDLGGNITESSFARPINYDPTWYLQNKTPGGPDYGSSIELTTIKQGIVTTKTVDTPVAYVICVANAGNIWMVGGSTSDFLRAQIAASLDGGDTWQIVWEGTGGPFEIVTCIVAAPLTDFPSEILRA